MTSKQRAYLKGLAMKIDPIFQIGKSSITPEMTTAIDQALEAREFLTPVYLRSYKLYKEDTQGLSKLFLRSLCS